MRNTTAACYDEVKPGICHFIETLYRQVIVRTIRIGINYVFPSFSQGPTNRLLFQSGTVKAISKILVESGYLNDWFLHNDITAVEKSICTFLFHLRKYTKKQLETNGAASNCKTPDSRHYIPYSTTTGQWSER